MKQYGTALRELLTLVAEIDADADTLLLPVTCLIVHPLVYLGSWYVAWFCGVVYPPQDWFLSRYSANRYITVQYST